MLARAPRASWEASIPARSTSVRMSPFRTTSRPAVSAAAFLTPPAVPSGSPPPAGRPERLRLHGVAEPPAELPPVPEARLDGLDEVGAGQDDVHHAVPAQEGELGVEEGNGEGGGEGRGGG